jgi:hypothetical protein
VRHRRLDGRVLAAPFGEEAVETDRIDDGARQDVGADLRALLHHHDAHVGRKLLEPDRGREPARTRAHDHDVEFHAFAGGECVIGHEQSPSGAAKCACCKRHFPRLTKAGNRREERVDTE